MIGVKAKISRKRMRELSAQGQKAAQRRNLELVREAEKIAKRLVPVDTGALKGSIRVEETPKTATLVAGNEKVDYAVFVERGTVHQAPQPFIRPAIDMAMKRTRNRTFKMFT